MRSATGTDFGDVGRNVLRGPRQTNVDFSVIRRFRIDESKNVEFRAEFFNLFNHVNFANPINNPTPSLHRAAALIRTRDESLILAISAASPRLATTRDSFNSP